jgi:hypothetical protein
MTDLISHRKAASPCPFCGKVMDCASNIEGKGAPEPGDVSLCIYCGGVMIFDRELVGRKPTDPELFALALSDCWPTVERARRAIMIELHRRKVAP